MHISWKDLIVIEILLSKNDESKLDLALSLDSKSADKELKAVTPEKREACITAFTKKVDNILSFNEIHIDLE